MYKEKRSSRSEFVPIRGLSYHVQVWPAAAGPASASTRPPLVLVHGWMDVAASWQFMVDALSDAFAQGRTIIAPDWRGFGLTCSAEQRHVGDAQFSAGPPQGKLAPSGGSALHEVKSVGAADTYWFADYLADLDFLLDHYAAGQAVDLVGHSMGGNVAMLYAGVRPARIRKLVNLEGFGLPASKPSQAPARYAKWMDELKSLHRGELDLKAYNDVDGVARRLMRTNPRLSSDKAHWLANHWARPDASGKWRILGDAAHKITSAHLYRLDEALEIYRQISAPTLSVEASDDSLATWWKGSYTLAQYHERLKQIPQAQVAVVQDAGHMLHHDQPEQLARRIEDFLG
ncbi:alpha/beta fold hydrolase [Polaromonas sp. JS666]|uniref:alpha/beta fold hydrolase n=1 Tax=Polaromonas sp. (strain JS666 / ATCC BAA-500) TaxID=296591 RepID=UPI0000464759|nr:alpha/beta hydrolase [Polaromonas sp. JS666]ABE43527.1 alpha/beta hydrolase fold protein [Polaromonas sp. JS666]